jgi:hypothetical protein
MRAHWNWVCRVGIKQLPPLPAPLLVALERIALPLPPVLSTIASAAGALVSLAWLAILACSLLEHATLHCARIRRCNAHFWPLEGAVHGVAGMVRLCLGTAAYALFFLSALAHVAWRGVRG